MQNVIRELNIIFYEHPFTGQIYWSVCDEFHPIRNIILNIKL